MYIHQRVNLGRGLFSPQAKTEIAVYIELLSTHRECHAICLTHPVSDSSGLRTPRLTHICLILSVSNKDCC